MRRESADEEEKKNRGAPHLLSDVLLFDKLRLSTSSSSMPNAVATAVLSCATVRSGARSRKMTPFRGLCEEAPAPWAVVEREVLVCVGEERVSLE